MDTALYIHIPFCKKRCTYCDFFSITDINLIDDYIHHLCKELQEQKNYLPLNSIKTIYFGGGTPSLLSKSHFEQLFQSLEENQYYKVGKEYEITLEINPEDVVNLIYKDTICSFPFNRISIGIQSFHDNELQWLGRNHQAISSIQAVLYLQQLQYQNISIDLIYGIPGQSLQTWEETIHQAVNLNIQHISAYHLTYEKNTVLYNQLQQKIIQPVKEDTSIQMAEMLRNNLSNFGFKQYEISNFAQSGYYSKHNFSYWNGNHYLGIGVSSHSYNGKSRQFNKQIKNINNYKPEIEIIDKKIAYNDFIITRLRTMNGISLNELELWHGKAQKAYCLHQAKRYLTHHSLEIVSNYLRLTREGVYIADKITCDLLN